MITLNLTRGKDLEGIYIRLPAPQEKIEEAIARLDVISEDTATTRILNVSSRVCAAAGGGNRKRAGAVFGKSRRF